MEIGSKLYKKVMNLQNSRSFTNDKDLEWDKIEKITKQNTLKRWNLNAINFRRMENSSFYMRS